MFKNYKVELDIASGRSIHPLIQVNTNDLDSFKVDFVITHNRDPIDLTGKTARIAVLKPDKKTVFQDCEITDAENGKGQVVLTSQAYSVQGNHFAEIMVYDGQEKVVVTGRFVYKAEKGLLNDGTVESTNEWQSINKAIADAENILIDLRENGTGVDAQAREELNSVNQKLVQTQTEARTKNERSLTTIKQGKKEKKTIVSIVLDDGQIADYNSIKPIAERTGAKFGIGVITSKVGTDKFMTWEQLHEMENTGLFEIMSHTHLHRDSTTITPEELDDDLRTSMTLLINNGFNPDGFVYPYNSNNDATEKIVRKYFTYAFSKVGGDIVGRNDLAMGNFKIRRVALGSYFDTQVTGAPAPETLEYYKWQVDQAVANNNWLVFVVHPQVTDATQLSYLEQTIDYIQSLGIDIVFPSEGFDIYGNIVETKEFIISQTGDVNSTFDRVVVDNTNARNMSDDILSYPLRKITYTTINTTHASSEGFPESKAGILITYNLDSYYSYRYQKYIILSSWKEYTRKVDSNLMWLDWETNSPQDALYMSKHNSYSANNSILDFPIDKVTYTLITDGTGFPTTKGGILITTRVTSEWYGAKQEYRVSPTNNAGVKKVHERYVNSDYTWTAWTEVV